MEPVQSKPQGDSAKTVGVGLSPGDSGRPLPYFFIDRPAPDPIPKGIP